MKYPDACPECDPATHPASLPDLAGVYACPSGHRWRTTHDVFGWPVERVPASVSPEFPAPPARSDSEVEWREPPAPERAA